MKWVSATVVCLLVSIACGNEIKPLRKETVRSFYRGLETTPSLAVALNLDGQSTDGQFFDALGKLIKQNELQVFGATLNIEVERILRRVDGHQKVWSAINRKVVDIIKIQVLNLSPETMREQLTELMEDLLHLLVNGIGSSKLAIAAEDAAHLLDNLKGPEFLREFRANHLSLDHRVDIVEIMSRHQDSDLGNRFMGGFEMNGGQVMEDWLQEVIPDPLKEITRARPKRYIKTIGKHACSVLKVASSVPLVGDSMLSEYIIKNIPDNWKSEFMHTLIRRGVSGLILLSKRLCGHSSDADLGNLLGVYEKLFPGKEVEFEKFLAFSEWTKVSVNSALQASQDSFANLEGEAEKVLSEAAKESESVGEMFINFELKNVDEKLIESVNEAGKDLAAAHSRAKRDLIGLKYVRGFACSLWQSINNKRASQKEINSFITGSSLPRDWKQAFLQSLVKGGSEALLKILSVFQCED